VSKPELNVKQRRSPHQTQWAAQFAVAGELCKQGYEVALTMGNHPVADLMIISPNHVHFLIDVKGLYKPNRWLVRARPAQKMLFYVLVFVPENKPNQFFILTQKQINEGLRISLENANARRRAKGLTIMDEKFTDIEWKIPFQHENVWKNLPA
jgi:hypothetical protein